MQKIMEEGKLMEWTYRIEVKWVTRVCREEGGGMRNRQEIGMTRKLCMG